jgi:hypothetical protein
MCSSTTSEIFVPASLNSQAFSGLRARREAFPIYGYSATFYRDRFSPADTLRAAAMACDEEY